MTRVSPMVIQYIQRCLAYDADVKHVTRTIKIDRQSGDKTA